MASESEVRIAKEAAVERYMATTTVRPQRTTLAAFTRPELNVVGIGVGEKLVDGKGVKDLSVRFYVERKLPLAVVGQGSALPKSINGVPTDVIETGRFRLLPAPALAFAGTSPNQQRMRPARPGGSCGFRFPPSAGMVMAGTFGAVVKDANGEYILSNNHVLADEGSIPIGSPIFQPGLLDGGNAATDAIARLSKFIPIAPSALNHVDCAIARLDSQTIADPEFLANVGRLNSPAPVNSTIDMAVMKTGRTSGFTTGRISDIHATVSVEYTVGVCRFDEQMIIVGDGPLFSAAGDSGSVIVDRGSGQATGLLFAGSASHTIANRIEAVLTALGIQLVV